MDTSRQQPTFEAKSFVCPHCHVYSSQTWCIGIPTGYSEEYQEHHWGNTNQSYISICLNCNGHAYWYRNPKSQGSAELVHPCGATRPIPTCGLTTDEQNLYAEACKVSAISPRSAAALLRVIIESIAVRETDANRGTLNDKLNTLIDSRALSAGSQEGLHAVRLLGNESVHVPGQILVEDDPEIVDLLFEIVDTIVDELFVLPEKNAQLLELARNYRNNDDTF